MSVTWHKSFVMNSLGHISGVDNARELNVKPT